MDSNEDVDLILKNFFDSNTLDNIIEKSDINKNNKINNENDNIYNNSEDIIIGIDLGTTNSCVSIWRNNNIEIIPDDTVIIRYQVLLHLVIKQGILGKMQKIKQKLIISSYP